MSSAFCLRCYIIYYVYLAALTSTFSVLIQIYKWPLTLETKCVSIIWYDEYHLSVLYIRSTTQLINNATLHAIHLAINLTFFIYLPDSSSFCPFCGRYLFCAICIKVCCVQHLVAKYNAWTIICCRRQIVHCAKKLFNFNFGYIYIYKVSHTKAQVQ